MTSDKGEREAVRNSLQESEGNTKRENCKLAKKLQGKGTNAHMHTHTHAHTHTHTHTHSVKRSGFLYPLLHRPGLGDGRDVTCSHQH